MSRLPTSICTAALAAVTLAACSGGGGAAAPAPGPAAAPATLTPPPGVILSANSTAQLGTVVIDGQGYTLYRYERDTAQPPAATCVDECAAAWPPVLAEPGAPLTLEGVEEAAVGTVTRSDGAVQLTLAGWPLYRCAADPQPGATAGQGVDGEWFAVTPDGGRASSQ
jgi:predicted lipoprotein with Yx(FWY)xxD motif